MKGIVEKVLTEAAKPKAESQEVLCIRPVLGTCGFIQFFL